MIPLPALPFLQKTQTRGSSVIRPIMNGIPFRFLAHCYPYRRQFLQPNAVVSLQSKPRPLGLLACVVRHLQVATVGFQGVYPLVVSSR